MGADRDVRRMVALTFDDGFECLYRNVFPLVARQRDPVMVFLVARTLVNGPLEADWVHPAEASPRPTLGLDQVLEMADAGVEFGSHSWAHHDLTQLSEDECVKDLTRSREALEDLLGRPVPFFAYPYGFHAPHVRRAAERAGYAYALTLPEWGERLPPGPHAVPRAGIYRGEGTLALRTKSTAWYASVRSNAAVAAARAAASAPRRAGRPDVGAPEALLRGAAALRAETRRMVAGHRRIYMTLITRTDRRADRVWPSTSVLVDGFPRSGNTFAVALIREAFPGLTVASHLHATAHVKQALADDVPAIVLIRDPVDAIASLSLREPRIPLRTMLRAYADFYESLAALRHELIAVRFERLVEDPAEMLRTVATRLGSQPPPAVDQEFLARVRDKIEQMEIAAAGGVLDEMRVPRPSAERTVRNRAARERVTRGYPRLLSRCRRAHDAFCAA